MSSRSFSDNHGLLRPWERDRAFRLHGVAPSPRLSHLVDRHWIVQWDLRARQPFLQEVLPHPSVNLVVEPHGGWVWGVPTKRASRLLEAQGWAVGTKFRPGVFTAVTGIEASSITDGCVTIEAAFGESIDSPGFAAGEDALHALMAVTEALLAPHADVNDPHATLVDDTIDSMRHLGPHARVEQLAAMHHLAPRTLQRLFRRYVGVGPKWVLKRLRIHQAAEQLADASPPAWTDLALSLGYYDHAHFIRDFRLIVGRSPAEYAAEAASARDKQGLASPAERQSRVA